MSTHDKGGATGETVTAEVKWVNPNHYLEVRAQAGALRDEVESLKATVKRLRKRLRAVKQYHALTDSHIDSIIRRGYGS